MDAGYGTVCGKTRPDPDLCYELASDRSFATVLILKKHMEVLRHVSVF
jgi:hypothetical protein